jgi:hypothetical protein
MIGGSDLDTARWVHNHLNIDGAPAPVSLLKFKRKNLAKLFRALGYKRGAEIGVESGRFSWQICTQNPGVELLCVDAWVKYRGYERTIPQAKFDEKRQEAEKRLAPFNTTLVREFSMDAVRSVPLGSLDFVYIDGNHHFDYVMQDIIEWSKRVRKGGIVSGHDYYTSRNVEVIPAVQAYTQAHGINEWFLTGEVGKSLSWFWVKTWR